uniref:Uncharacterized protein n=1 Tax=Glossina palpalis gambiensis TaxID=67801 RepID=A0A1B0BWY0_9MUSC
MKDHIVYRTRTNLDVESRVKLAESPAPPTEEFVEGSLHTDVNTDINSVIQGSWQLYYVIILLAICNGDSFLIESIFEMVGRKRIRFHAVPGKCCDISVHKIKNKLMVDPNMFSKFVNSKKEASGFPSFIRYNNTEFSTLPWTCNLFANFSESCCNDNVVDIDSYM